MNHQLQLGRYSVVGTVHTIRAWLRSVRLPYHTAKAYLMGRLAGAGNCLLHISILSLTHLGASYYVSSFTGTMTEAQTSALPRPLELWRRQVGPFSLQNCRPPTYSRMVLIEHVQPAYLLACTLHLLPSSTCVHLLRRTAWNDISKSMLDWAHPCIGSMLLVGCDKSPSSYPCRYCT